MTDKELIELAAKAAGIEWNKAYKAHLNENGAHWLPLTDDGDAFRLAVKLGMTLDLPTQTSVYVKANDQLEYCKNEDHYAATRRAIVRAAAEIGRTME